MQFVRIFIIPMRAHGATTIVNNETVKVMGDGQFFKVIAYLICSGLALLAAGYINMKKSNELTAHLKEIGEIA